MSVMKWLRMRIPMASRRSMLRIYPVRRILRIVRWRMVFIRVDRIPMLLVRIGGGIPR